MGWAGGSGVLLEVWTAVRKFVPEKQRVKLFAKLIKIVEDEDCDTVYELDGKWPEVRPAMILCGHSFDEEDEEDKEN